MHSKYADIRERIPEDPVWYDLHAVPRYGAPPEVVLPFMGRIRCQSCHRQFWVCLVDEVYTTWMGKMILEEYSRDAQGEVIVCSECREPKVTYRNGSMYRHGGRYLLADGSTEAREEQWLPLPDRWAYGDPPIHDCVGDTMSSDAEWKWAAIDGART